MTLIEHEGIEFKINDDGVLIRMENVYGRYSVVTHVEIPSVLDGIKITAIGERFCVGTYEEIVVSPEIHAVQEGAFRTADVGIVHWPKTCTVIPENCFRCSLVKQVLGIEDVEEIGNTAFWNCAMPEFNWPPKCEVIPDGCFSNSELWSIRGTENVKRVGNRAFFGTHISDINVKNAEEIGIEAFAHSTIRYIEWPDKFPKIPRACFYLSGLKSITNLKNVTQIEEYAFAGAEDLKGLNLSDSMILTVGEGAFEGVRAEENIFPYYTDESAFKGSYQREDYL